MNKENISTKILAAIGTEFGIRLISEAVKALKNNRSSFIVVEEWDNSYNNVNKLLYELDSEKYKKRMIPNTNKDVYELNIDVCYMIKLKGDNYISVYSYRNKDDKTYYSPHKLKLTFIGKNRYANRTQFLMNASQIIDKHHIRVTYLNEHDIVCDTIPHDFDNIIMKKDVRNDIINGLESWKNSREWYNKHQLIYKIGVLLYGKAGTGKSTIVRAISTMFNNAPILTVNITDMMLSINKIHQLRKRKKGTIIVLIEDIDMFFESREKDNRDEREGNDKKLRPSKIAEQLPMNQNYLFQLLDGVYSSDDTIFIATTNYKERLDYALMRHGRFDIQEELTYFNEAESLEAVKMFGYNKKVLNSFKLAYPVEPSYLQSKIMEYRSDRIKTQWGKEYEKN